MDASGHAAAVASSGVVQAASVRRARVAGIPKGGGWAWLYGRLWEMANSTNEHLWRFAIAPATMEHVQYSVYASDERGGYGWHEDVGFHTGTAARVLSATVQLSDSGAYAGGDVELRIGSRKEAIERRQGAVTFFPSHVAHRVAPVTAGERHSLVLWVALDAPEPEDQSAAPTVESALSAATAAAAAPTVQLRQGGAASSRPCLPLRVATPDGRSHSFEWPAAGVGGASLEEATLSFCQGLLPGAASAGQAIKAASNLARRIRTRCIDTPE